MRAMHETDVRDNFEEALDVATEDNDVVIVTRSGGKEAAVIISLAEYSTLNETTHPVRAELAFTVNEHRELLEKLK